MVVLGALELLELLMAVRGALELPKLKEIRTWMVLQSSLLVMLLLRLRASPKQARKGEKRRLRRWDQKDPPRRSWAQRGQE